MRAWILSDLHIDISPRHMKVACNFQLPAPQPEHDLAIIAGDIREQLTKGLKWVQQAGFTKDVIVVGGNHCFYRTSRDRELEKAREIAATSRDPRIHLLQDNTLVLGGVRFVGATLWTDYRLHGEHTQQLAMLACETGMNDHRLIRVASQQYGRFRPQEALAEHERSRWYIEKILAEPFAGPTVVITHHAPSVRSYGRRYSGTELLSAGYASHMDALVDRCDLWIHGHLHDVSDYRLGDGRVICNPRGYEALGESSGWNPMLVVDLMEVHACRQKRALSETSEPAR